MQAYKTSHINNRRYLGNKYKLLPFISRVVREECHDVNVVADIFAGTGAVSSVFQDKILITNDLMYSNYICNYAWFSGEPYDLEKIVSAVISYNALRSVEDNYMTEHFSDTYFSRDDCAKIGFIRADRLKNIGFGLALGAGFYTIAYAVECIVLYVQGASPSLKIASGGFSLVKSTEFVSTGIAFILLFNVLNVWMEEGLFRGLFTRLLRERYDCRMTIFITALLFGLWHLIMPVRSFIEGQMKLAPMLLLGAGYVALTFVYGLKMSFLYRMTGSVWAGLSEHFFNNSIINIVHVVSSMGSDHLQVVRIVTAQLLSFIFVTILYLLKRKNLLPVF